MPKLSNPKPLPTIPQRSLSIDGPYCKKTIAIWPVAVVALLVAVLIAVHVFATYIR